MCQSKIMKNKKSIVVIIHQYSSGYWIGYVASSWTSLYWLFLPFLPLFAVAQKPQKEKEELEED